jgi:glutamate dehydrogenase
MSQTIRPPVSDLRAETIALLQAADPSVALVTFAQHYLDDISTADLSLFPAAHWAASIRNMWANARTRAPAKVAMHCYAPADASNPWDGKCTVLDVAMDDMPFLVDSIVAAIHNAGHSVQLCISPVLNITRSTAHDVQLVGAAQTAAVGDEAWMQFLFDETTPAQQAELTRTITNVLHDVRCAVEDWPQMRKSLFAAQEQLVRSHIVAPADLTEAQTFLSWLDNEHFTFLGCRDYTIKGTGDAIELSVTPQSGLGILRDDTYVAFSGLRDGHNQPPEVRAFLNEPRLLLVTKSSRASTVHRSVTMDAVFIKLFDTNGRITGERLILGLFTSLAYSRNARDIPIIRNKVQRITDRSGIKPKSHDGKALIHILDTYPRDELFQINDDDLFTISTGIMRLQERRRVALFVRRDPFQRFVSCFVYIPREAFSTTTRVKAINTLEAAFNGRLRQFTIQMDENPLMRLHVTISSTNERLEHPDLAAVEQMIAAFCRSWHDRLRDTLLDSCDKTTALALLNVYGDAFSSTYRDTVAPEDVYGDILALNQVRDSHKLGVRLQQQDTTNSFSLKLYHPDSSVMLSATLPMIENLGFTVENEYGPFQISLPDGKSIWLHDYHVRATKPLQHDFTAIGPLAEESFSRTWYGHVENDHFNQLVLAAAIDWRHVNIMRVLAKYMRQLRVLPFAPDTVAEAFVTHPAACRLLTDYFAVKFNPAITNERNERLADLDSQIDAYIKAVPNIDDDRILRHAHNLLRAALRTNFYQTATDGQPKAYTSIKFRSADIDGLPLPKPYAEIFVYSPRMKGIHLRGGKVARGGIRWSDRREDFRTEVLGLMKAQQVKNTVIVPVGSKGGFIVKHPNTANPQAEGIACYQTLMRGMLDITDNIVDGAVVPPADVVRHDGDDPYLVVAADKGTAQFSDIANAISAEYNFWLGDAFASGGSAGYDHKHMAITARGAWEAVKRHFRELGVDTQTTPFTCVGVGDMAGDVFGNGLLQSPHTRLVAAFNYAHIFVDPNPDIATSYRERQRLFTLGKGSWDGYDTALISTGGGVWPRTQKSIPISPEMRECLGITAETLSANDLMKAILQAPVDLLFLGGIGTYIKAPDETDADVGDKANDALRINATALRARVVGEGANLGFTQRGRIAAAQAGVKLNTDAIDNSAGVDTSDHEVNIKILLSRAVANGSLTLPTRNELLKGMTDEVAALVLRDNYLQTQVISVSESRASEQITNHKALLHKLEQEVGLLRAVEFLPTDEAISARAAARQGLTRPELAVLLAYCKIWFNTALLASPLPADACVADDVKAYFPAAIQNMYADLIPHHPLLRELAATVLTNDIINRVGMGPLLPLMQKTSAENIARAYIVLRDAFNLRTLWAGIEQLDNIVSASVQTTLLLAINRSLDQGLHALVTMPQRLLDVPATTAEYRTALADVQKWLHSQGGGASDDGVPTADTRVPATIQSAMALLPWLPLLPRLCHVMHETQQPLTRVIPLFMAIDDRLQLRRLHRHLGQQSAENPWQAEALTLLADDMLLIEQRLTANLIRAGAADFEQWLAARQMSLQRYDQLATAVRAAGTNGADMALWTLLVRELVWLAGI